MPDDADVRVTNREIYDAVQELLADVAAVKREIIQLGLDSRELTKRVRALELRFYGILAGLLGAIAVALRLGGAV